MKKAFSVEAVAAEVDIFIAKQSDFLRALKWNKNLTKREECRGLLTVKMELNNTEIINKMKS